MNKKQLKEWAKTPMVCHCLMHEYKWFLSRGIKPNIVHDSMLSAFFVDSRQSLKLVSLAQKIGADKYYKVDKVSSLEENALEVYNCRDSRNCLLVHNHFYPLMTDEERALYHEVFIPAAKVLAEVELHGLRVDPKKLAGLQKELHQKQTDLKLDKDPIIKQFNRNSEKTFNAGSSQHKIIVAYDMLGYPVFDTTPTGNPSAQAKTLEYLLKQRPNKTLEKIIQYSRYNGWLNFYGKTLPEALVELNGNYYVYSSLMLAGAITGRLISSKPNLQNIAGAKSGGLWTRKVFVPRGGWFLEFDYDQIELRLWAGLTQDERLIDGFKNGDPHIQTACDIYGKKPKSITKMERYHGKTVNYIMVNGGGAWKLALDTGLPVNEAKTLIKKYWLAHKAGKDFVNTLPDNGWCKSCTGMKRWVTRQTQARNHQIQNPALVAHLIGLNKLYPEYQKLGMPVVLPVHDSLLIDSPKKPTKKILQLGRDILEEFNYDWMPIPLSVSAKIGRSWGEMEEVKI